MSEREGSPTAIIWTTIFGKISLLESGSAILDPTATFSRTSSNATSITRLPDALDTREVQTKSVMTTITTQEWLGQVCLLLGRLIRAHLCNLARSIFVCYLVALLGLLPCCAMHQRLI